MDRISKNSTTKWRKFLEIIFFVFSVDYLLLFGAETILPGFVIKVFNLNYLLFGLVAVWSLLLYFGKEEKTDQVTACPTLKYAETILLIFLMVVLVISLYKLSWFLIILYAILATTSWLAMRKFVANSDF